MMLISNSWNGVMIVVIFAVVEMEMEMVEGAAEGVV